MLWHGKLDSRLRELAIMRIGWLTASRLRMDTALAGRAGTRGERRRSARCAGLAVPRGFGPAERAVLAATDDVVRDGAVSARELGGVRSANSERSSDAR